MSPKSPGLFSVVKSRGPELIIEAFFVVFAVLVALAVDEWSRERELEKRADRARSAVISEIRSNDSELRTGLDSTMQMLNRVTAIVEKYQAGEEVLEADVSGNLPDFSDAAWETARLTGAVERMDYEWVLETARVYDAQDLTWSIQRNLVLSMGGLVAHGLDEDRFRDLQGQLMILVGLQGELLEKYQSLLQ